MTYNCSVDSLIYYLAMVSVGEHRGYLSYLVDEIAYLQEDTLSFPSRDELLIKSIRESLDSLNISNYVNNGKRNVPTIRVEGQDSLIKIYTALPNNRFSTQIRDHLSNSMEEESLKLLSTDETEVSYIGWLVAVLDYRLRCYKPPKYRLLITSRDVEFMAALVVVIVSLGIEYKLYKSNSLLSLSIGKLSSIKKVADLPINERLRGDLDVIIKSRPVSKYDYERIGRLHEDGSSISSICSSMGIPKNRVGYIAFMLRKKGYEVKTQR